MDEGSPPLASAFDRLHGILWRPRTDPHHLGHLSAWMFYVGPIAAPGWRMQVRNGWDADGRQLRGPLHVVVVGIEPDGVRCLRFEPWWERTLLWRLARVAWHCVNPPHNHTSAT